MLAKSLFADEYVLYFSWLNPHVGEMLNPNVAASTPPCPGTLLGLTSFFSDQRPWVSWIVPIMLTIAALLKKKLCPRSPLEIVIVLGPRTTWKFPAKLPWIWCFRAATKQTYSHSPFLVDYTFKKHQRFTKQKIHAFEKGVEKNRENGLS